MHAHIKPAIIKKNAKKKKSISFTFFSLLVERDYGARNARLSALRECKQLLDKQTKQQIKSRANFLIEFIFSRVRFFLSFHYQ
jgi:hypothetical protein